MLVDTRDPEVGARYITTPEEAGSNSTLVWRTQVIENATVNIDYGPDGQILGVEIL